MTPLTAHPTIRQVRVAVATLLVWFFIALSPTEIFAQGRSWSADALKRRQLFIFHVAIDYLGVPPRPQSRIGSAMAKAMSERGRALGPYGWYKLLGFALAKQLKFARRGDDNHRLWRELEETLRVGEGVDKQRDKVFFAAIQGRYDNQVLLAIGRLKDFHVRDVLSEIRRQAPLPASPTARGGSKKQNVEYDRCSSGRPSLSVDLSIKEIYRGYLYGTPSHLARVGPTRVIMFGDFANDNDMDEIKKMLRRANNERVLGGNVYIWSRCGKVYASDTYPTLTQPICGCTAAGRGKPVAAFNTSPFAGSGSGPGPSGGNTQQIKNCCAVGDMLEINPELGQKCDRLVGGDFSRWGRTNENCQRVLYPDRYR